MQCVYLTFDRPSYACAVKYVEVAFVYLLWPFFSLPPRRAVLKQMFSASWLRTWGKCGLERRTIACSVCLLPCERERCSVCLCWNDSKEDVLLCLSHLCCSPRSPSPR